MSKLLSENNKIYAWSETPIKIFIPGAAQIEKYFEF